MLRDLLRKAIALSGVDWAIGWTILSRCWGLLSGPTTIFLIAQHLSPTEQGVFYTFGSILGLTVFVELGLLGIITQFAAHERGRLSWSTEGHLSGDITAKERLASLLRFSLRWYRVASLLAGLIIIPVGIVFFRSHSSLPSSDWLYPWLIACIATMLGLSLSPLWAVLEGCGLIAKIAGVRLVQQIVGSLTVWSALLLGVGLYGNPVSSTISLLIGCTWLFFRNRKLITDLYRVRSSNHISWKSELLPLQWRVGLSWLSGYFIFTIVTPMSFAFFGPEVAGRIGMTTTLLGQVQLLSQAWVSTKAAPMGMLVARKEYSRLDSLFRGALLRGMFLAVVGVSCIILLSSLPSDWTFGVSSRMLPPDQAMWFGLSTLGTVLVSCLALYLRSHKREPYLSLSLIGALLTSSVLFVASSIGSFSTLLVGYAAIQGLIGPFLGYLIFRKCRRAWHEPAA